jgi:hypothetical protein
MEKKGKKNAAVEELQLIQNQSLYWGSLPPSQ